ncbi:MAG: DUF2182 domain-containing protein [Pseudomonadota bacterium]
MSARLISRYADDPRVVTFIVVTLIAAAMWLATWQVMGGMSGMSMDMDMDMPGMSENMPMPGMSGNMDDTGAMGGESGMKMDVTEAPKAMEGMGQDGSKGSMPTDGMSDGKPMGAMQMDMPGMSMNPADWSLGTISVTIAMWILMMAAMMLPAMAPVTAIYAGLAAKEDRGLRLASRIGLFLTGYFALWAAFSVVAALGQLSLRGSSWFAMGGTLALPFAAGLLLIVAGAYQFTPVKEFCLRHCRHPLTYLMSHWREGLAGAFPVGARHGLYCFGCCVALMGLMFVFGAMNVIWMAVIALYFLAEKILPRAEIWGRIAGALMIVAGAATVANELI